MDDEFLQRIRVQPSREFSARLQARLDMRPCSGRLFSYANVVRVVAATLLLGAAAAAVRSPTVGGLAKGFLASLRSPDRETVIVDRSDPSPSTPDREAVLADIRSQPATTSTPKMEVNARKARISQNVTAKLPAEAEPAPATAIPVNVGSPVIPVGTYVSNTVRTDGSSTVFPMAEAIVEAFQTEKRGHVRVTVGISGSGGGFKRLCRGEMDISYASRPIRKEEMDECARAGIEYIELPVAYDVLEIVINADNTWVDAIAVDELKTLWETQAQGRILRWNQIRAGWPDRPIKLVGPDVDSATSDFFTEVVLGGAKSGRQDFIQSEYGNVILDAVGLDQNALAYIRQYPHEGNALRVKVASVVNSQGVAAMPTSEAVMDGTYEPLSRPLFIYVQAAAAERSEVREFVEYFLTHAAAIAPDAALHPLAEDAYAAALKKFRRGSTGTAFDGTPQTGLTVDRTLTKGEK